MSTVIGWKVRHEGAPRRWTASHSSKSWMACTRRCGNPPDEVQAPGEATWTAIENHPQLAEIAAESNRRLNQAEEEVRLDMTP